jgi:hypothetical protein
MARASGGHPGPGELAPLLSDAATLTTPLSRTSFAPSRQCAHLPIPGSRPPRQRVTSAARTRVRAYHDSDRLCVPCPRLRRRRTILTRHESPSFCSTRPRECSSCHGSSDSCPRRPGRPRRAADRWQASAPASSHL